ncbi:MAG: hypothetical protein PHO32_04430 [Candidatus Cloacimonetes bacterium]|nr:hypothetical protein [Candidatus Cloacimonadota bacterium]
MKIAIHSRQGSFSDRWISYCEEKEITFKIVNCCDSDIIEQLRDCNGLMWHWSHEDYRAQNYARQLIYSLEKDGIFVFPNFDTCWHFDDKVGQKYLFESIGAPLVPTHVFYDKAGAISWVKKTDFPMVFKLRGGAGSQNVMLVKSAHEAVKLINRAFSRGFPLVDGKAGLKQRIWVLKRDNNFKAVVHLLKGFIRLLIPAENLNLLQTQKGYIYFQDFIPNNDFDDRIVVVGDRAFAIRRRVREKDFRASGSGIFDYDPSSFNLEAVKIAFEVTKKINSQTAAFDFVYDLDNKPLIVEISYSYSVGSAYDNCPGYWDSELIWHESKVNPQYFIIEDFLRFLKNSAEKSRKA